VIVSISSVSAIATTIAPVVMVISAVVECVAVAIAPEVSSVPVSITPALNNNRREEYRWSAIGISRWISRSNAAGERTPE
jgi:hypothetical protein